jgi:hypothetical protein
VLAGKTVLDCCAGPAAFAMQAQEWNIHVTACDQRYGQSAEDLRQTVDSDAISVLNKQKKTPEYFHKELVPVESRRQAMELFLQDYERNLGSGRYVFATLPVLPFPDQRFALALCANFLFIYSSIESGGMMENSPFDYQFHQDSIAELLRVSKGDVRLYPLQGPKMTEHKYLQPIRQYFSDQGFEVQIEPVRQRDIIGAEKMLRIGRKV